MSRGEFRGTAHVARGQLMRVFHAETSQAILTRGMDDTSFATFIPITPGSEASLWRGRRLSRGHLVVKSPEVDYYNQTSPGAAIRGLLVPVETLREATSILTAREPRPMMAPSFAVRPPAWAFSRLNEAVATLLTASVRIPGHLGTLEGHALEQECLRRLIDCLTASAGPPTPLLRHDVRSRLVGRAVDVMHEQLDQPLSALTLCAELGVSDRALRLAFGEAFGMGPLAYFRLIRMHAIRAALRAARGGEESVADIARRWGFHRLGSFAGEYRRQFGELPSETLGVRGWPGVQHMARLAARERIAPGT